MLMQKSDYLVITPTFNEAENIKLFTTSILNLGIDLLIIDDSSPDKTGEIIKLIQKDHKNLFLISRESKLGLGSAYREGFDWAQKNDYKFIIEMDADFSHRIEDLEKLISFNQDYGLLIGSRYVPGGTTVGWDKKRKVLSKYANSFTKFLLRSKVNDLTSGFRIYTKESLNKINYKKIKSDGYSFQIEMTANAIFNNINIIEVPITFEERRLGQSKMSFSIIIEAVIKIFVLGLKRFIN
tara:strand:- start:403 stop:1119 length:717 start_codon:yes stop_codon:yes gene_type:complete